MCSCPCIVGLVICSLCTIFRSLYFYLAYGVNASVYATFLVMIRSRSAQSDVSNETDRVSRQTTTRVASISNSLYVYFPSSLPLCFSFAALALFLCS